MNCRLFYILQRNEDGFTNFTANNLMLKRGLLLLALLASISAVAQESNGLLINSAIYRGKIIKNFPEFPEVNTGYYYEVGVSKQTWGKRRWNKWWGYPEIGVSFLYGQLGNKEELGESYSLMSTMTIHFLDEKRFETGLHVELGGAYFNTRYHPTDNRTNLVIGTRFTAAVYAGLQAQYKLDKWGIKLGAGQLHNSNGHTALPNLGANTPVLSVGLSYAPRGRAEIKEWEPDTLTNNRWRTVVRLGLGYQEFGSFTAPTLGSNYPVYTGSLYWQKRYANRNALQAGIHVNYYTGFHDYIVSQQLFDDQEVLKSSNYMVFVGHEFLKGHMGLQLQIGLNVYKPFQREYLLQQQGSLGTFDKIKIYNGNKAGAHWYWFDPRKRTDWNIFAAFLIKSNFGQADFTEVSLGYVF